MCSKKHMTFEEAQKIIENKNRREKRIYWCKSCVAFHVTKSSFDVKKRLTK